MEQYEHEFYVALSFSLDYLHLRTRSFFARGAQGSLLFMMGRKLPLGEAQRQRAWDQDRTQYSVPSSLRLLASCG